MCTNITLCLIKWITVPAILTNLISAFIPMCFLKSHNINIAFNVFGWYTLYSFILTFSIGYLWYGYYGNSTADILIVSPFIMFVSVTLSLRFLTPDNLQSRSYIESLIKNYNSTTSNLLDDIQTTFKCCGISSDESIHWFIPFEVLNCKFEPHEVPQ